MVFCPASRRPFNAYGVSSNGIFELMRLERRYKFPIFTFLRPEILVYRTEYPYKENEECLNDILIGKVINPYSCSQMIAVAYENVNGIMKKKYEITSSLFKIGRIIRSLKPRSNIKFKIKDI